MNEDAGAIPRIAARFAFDGRFHAAERYGSGHINDTYAVRTIADDGSTRRYILQRLNTHVFRSPVRLMQNMAIQDQVVEHPAARRSSAFPTLLDNLKPFIYQVCKRHLAHIVHDTPAALQSKVPGKLLADRLRAFQVPVALRQPP